MKKWMVKKTCFKSKLEKKEIVNQTAIFLCPEKNGKGVVRILKKIFQISD